LHALALGLLLTAACLHVAWNLLLKRAAASDIVTWWALVAGSLLFLPVLLASGHLPLSASVWRLAVASAAVETVYYVLLAYAYGQWDFSQVYPMARGTAPVLLAVWSALLLREYPSAWGAAGIVVIVLGLVVVGGGRSGGPGRGLLAALGVALCTSLYSLIDGVAVRRGSPAPYTVAVLGLTAILIAPVALIRNRPAAVLAEGRRQWPRAVAAGALMMLGYMCVLRAYTIERLAYAGAVREVSVVLAALVGWRWLGESFGPRRVAGASAVFLGILMLAFFG